MSDAFDEYMVTSFRNYLKAHEIDLEDVADGCIEPGKEFRECEEDFNDKLGGIVYDFWNVLSNYVSENDIRYAVLDAFQFEDIVDEDRFTDDWIALSPRRGTPSRGTGRKPASKPRSAAYRPKAKAPAKKSPAKPKSKGVRR